MLICPTQILTHPGSSWKAQIMPGSCAGMGGYGVSVQCMVCPCTVSVDLYDGGSVHCAVYGVYVQCIVWCVCAVYGVCSVYGVSICMVCAVFT